MSRHNIFRALSKRSTARWAIASSMLLLLARFPAPAHAVLPCTTPLFGLGPVDPVHGFPQYYQDSTGLALQPCLDLVCDPALPVPDPTLPVSFPNNFPDEFFYSRVINTMTVGAMKVTYVAALEGSFANGVVVAGDQVVFARLRFRILGATPNATYTFTHPYGVDVVQADGVGFVNSTTDVGIVPIGLLPTAFQLAIGGRVGPFMTAVAPPPPAGLVGNPAVDQTVTGSACNQNFVRVEGPGFPVGGQQNNLFSTIIGRIAHICGNGVLDLGEQCDDGNLVAGDCCSPTCTFEPLGQPCGAPDVCVNNACNGAGTCALVNFTTAPCSDANVCTVADTCTLGACVGAPNTCDDANVCTTDFCTPPAVGCGHLNNALACNDGNAATNGDSCSGGGCMGAVRRATLALVGGENPSLPGFPAVGDARTDGTRTRVSLINMDPARFPAGCTGATITVGGISGTATVTPFAARAVPLVRATALNFVTNGTVAAGSTAAIRVRCTVGGVTHETRWSGVMANAPAPCTPTTCAAQGKNCGTIPDGCGGTLTCGVCTAPQTCGGGGVANVCGVGAPAPATALLTLTATGRAGESVRSTPAGLNVPVGTTGSASFAVGTSITLSATNGRSVIWSGVCSSGGIKTPTCTFTLNAASSETANVQ